ncbi:hypothetical protein EVAR_101770_1 [Eumeta japonica]|uniref:Uncharacterized protein n=1 Tax=Eumeta variegata TaxID=151549 RepID=A0A4C1SMJ9_EUMVA|nr:hypothetical protein EVAR_101770_1 [Eumeta japonica]
MRRLRLRTNIGRAADGALSRRVRTILSFGALVGSAWSSTPFSFAEKAFRYLLRLRRSWTAELRRRRTGRDCWERRARGEGGGARGGGPLRSQIKPHAQCRSVEVKPSVPARLESKHFDLKWCYSKWGDEKLTISQYQNLA